MISTIFTNELLQISTVDKKEFISIKTENTKYTLNAPEFEVNGEMAGGKDLYFTGFHSERKLRNSGTELNLEFAFTGSRHLKLIVHLRCFPGSPFVRYRYSLLSQTPAKLTKKYGRDNLIYTGLNLKQEDMNYTEIQFSQFDNIVHSYGPVFEEKNGSELEEGCSFPGPIFIVDHEKGSFLMAYEHGADYTEVFIEFKVRKNADRLYMNVKAVKGNYYTGEELNVRHPFTTPWFHIAAIDGNKNEMLRYYRQFFLKFIAENNESRKPYIFYNTWNAQERDKYYKGLPYLKNITYDHMISEIEIAYKMGIDVFAIDNGWFQGAGEWLPDAERFPDNLKLIKEKLNEYDMKLGLWFNPIMAVRASQIFQNHPEYMMKNEKGADWYMGTVWEKPDNYGMCLVSDFADYHITVMKKLYNEFGVTYFKWDGIYQFGCTSDQHKHGNSDNTIEERSDCYSFKMGLEMIRIVEELSLECPEVIVDYDITENKRFVGLGFLSVGKYFLINNGPYAEDFDFPYKPEVESNMVATKMESGANLFFFPGAARSRICRQGVKYDKFVPSSLFLAHFLPDAPVLSQMNSLCSLMLGPNGIWGELADLSEDDIKIFSETLQKYKRVRDSINESYPKTKGNIGTSPEIHEKINYDKSEGLICFFTVSKGTFTHITDTIETAKFCNVDGADSWEITPSGRLKITVTLEKNQARPVFVYGK